MGDLAFGVKGVAEDVIGSYFPFHIAVITAVGGEQHAFIELGFRLVGHQPHVITGGKEDFFGLFGPGGIFTAGFQHGRAGEGDGVPAP
ncbi:hypothetical protein FQZ97_939970 [compost metagenome]